MLIDISWYHICEVIYENEYENASHTTNGSLKKTYRWIQARKMAKDHIIKRLTRDVGQNKYSSKKIAQSSTK